VLEVVVLLPALVVLDELLDDVSFAVLDAVLEFLGFEELELEELELSPPVVFELEEEPPPPLVVLDCNVIEG
jgi:hypothetical protein